MEKKIIRLGLVGCGKMMKSHAQVVNKVETVQITAICDIDLQYAEQIRDELGNPYMTTDYKTMLDYVDAVLIALPHHLHYECGMFFAKNKKHILMEKPLCNTEQECLNLIEKCEDEKVVLMCAYPVRYMPGVVKLKELVDSGDFGKVIQMSIWTEQLTVAQEGHWSGDSRLGGGQFFSHGCHYVDILLWFLGQPVKGMHFGTRVGTEWMTGEGTSTAIIKFANGALGYHGATWGARGTKLYYSYQIQTEKGLLDYDRQEGQIRFYHGDEEHVPGQERTSREYEIVYEEKWETGKAMKESNYEIAHFADCVLNNKKPLTDGKSALEGLRAIWKMYDAERFDIVADLTDIKSV